MIIRDLRKVMPVMAGTVLWMTGDAAWAQDTASAATVATAEAAGVAPETAFILNTLLFLMTGFLVMFMAAGFAMLEAGLVRKRSVGTQCLKNIALFAIAGIMYHLVGYNLMYSGVDGGWIGSFAVWSPDDTAAAAGDYSAGYAASSDWFFQMVFVATAASIVSGTMAERVKVWPFLLFVVVLTGFIYPITGSWQWGGGWLKELGFSDFAGSTLVHSVGGWAALVGGVLLGARNGRFTRDGRSQPMPGSSLPLATLGTFILWLGWFGFNGGSQLALGSGADAIAVANIFINTNIAACGGVVAAMFASNLLFRKIDLTLALNGAIGGLVAITAEPLTPSLGAAVSIGAIGGVLVVVTVPILDRLKIDDVVGAIPAHLVCGVWGTMAVPLTNGDATFLTQAAGVFAVAAFTILTSGIVWLALRSTTGIRIHEEDEAMGIDQAEMGMDAYPEFGPGTVA